MNLRFGSWAPDIAGLNAKDGRGRSIMAIAKNVYPDPEGYEPISGLAVFQTGTGLSSTCLGMFSARTSAGGWVIFAGTQTDLFKYNSATGNWDNYSKSAGVYNVPSGDFWNF